MGLAIIGTTVMKTVAMQYKIGQIKWTWNKQTEYMFFYSIFRIVNTEWILVYLDWSIPFRMLPSEIWKTKNSQTDTDLKIRVEY